jgi:hypothetical protein
MTMSAWAPCSLTVPTREIVSSFEKDSDKERRRSILKTNSSHFPVILGKRVLALASSVDSIVC